MPFEGHQALVLDRRPDPLASPEGPLAPLERSAPRGIAYFMYASGSTGRPKGVRVPHRGVLRLVVNTNYAQMPEDARHLHFATIAFDASTLEIWGALANGAHPPSPRVLRPGPERGRPRRALGRSRARPRLAPRSESAEIQGFVPGSQNRGPPRPML
jgi:hypothetical protein